MRTFHRIVIFSSIVAASQGDPASAVKDLHFPKGVEFGMTLAELKTVRPTVKGGGSESFGGTDAVEMNVASNGVHKIYTYKFKDEKLGAIQYLRGRSISTNMLVDVETTLIHEKLSSSGAPMELLETVQAGQVLRVKLWTVQHPPMKVGFIATTDCTVVTFFSTNSFAFKDLFPSASDAEKRRANARTAIEEKIGEGTPKYPNGIDRLSTNAPPHAALSTK